MRAAQIAFLFAIFGMPGALRAQSVISVTVVVTTPVKDSAVRLVGTGWSGPSLPRPMSLLDTMTVGTPITVESEYAVGISPMLRVLARDSTAALLVTVERRGCGTFEDALLRVFRLLGRPCVRTSQATGGEIVITIVDERIEIVAHPRRLD
jgi:hypothetical protein